MTKHKKVPLCEQAGHIWVTTTSSSVRKCERCREAQHYKNGQWQAMQPQPKYKQEDRNTETQQPTLF